MYGKVRTPFTILGTGSYLPEKVLTNFDLENMVQTSDAWIRERTGIYERRIAAPEQSTSDLCAQALLCACKNAQIDLSDLDALIVATSTPDTMFPSTACWVQERLHIRGFPAFDISAGCTGFLYALELAASLIQQPAIRRIAVVGGEVMSKVVNWNDRHTCVLFGDGAGAVILGNSTSGTSGLLASNWGADGSLAKILYQPAGGTQRPASTQTIAEVAHTVHMNGDEVFRHAVRAMCQASQKVLENCSFSIDDLTLLIPHQANIRIIESIRRRLELPVGKVYQTVGRHGNISAASIPIALHEARQEGKIANRDVLLLTSFGTGLTWAASLLRWWEEQA